MLALQIIAVPLSRVGRPLWIATGVIFGLSIVVCVWGVGYLMKVRQDIEDEQGRDA